MMTHATPAGVPYLRTPAENFGSLPSYDFEPNYHGFEGLRLHYVDVGPRDGKVALLMHGMPSWSFLNRHIIKALSSAGWRCVAADHIGFGKSDKVTDDAWYSIARHTVAHRSLIESLDLRDVTLICQDWGGPTGLAQAVEMPERFSRLVIMNTWLHHEGYQYTADLREWNRNWKEDGLFGLMVPEKVTIGDIMAVALGYVERDDVMQMVSAGKALPLTTSQATICAAYDAPFEGLGRDGHAGARRFPLSLPFDNPLGGNAETQARHHEALLEWTKPIHFIWGAADPIFTAALGREWARNFNQATFDAFPDAGHFLQETHGDKIARLLLEYTS